MILSNGTNDKHNFTLRDSNNIIVDNIVPNCLNHLLPNGEGTFPEEAPLEAQDPFAWVVEGVLILIAFLVGIFGNCFSVIVFSRQKVHRIFHHLLLLLALFDIVSIYSPGDIFITYFDINMLYTYLHCSE